MSTFSYTSSAYAQRNRWDQRHLATVRYALEPRPGQRYLEVGCGRGHLVAELVAEGVRAQGVDANPHAAKLSVGPGLVSAGPADALAFDDDTFDVVASFHMIEHVPDVGAALAEMTRVLRPGGKLLLVYPAEPIRGVYAIPASVIMVRHPFKARQIHRHTIRPRRLGPRLEDLGMEVVGSRFRLLTTPQFETVARKPEA